MNVYMPVMLNVNSLDYLTPENLMLSAVIAAAATFLIKKAWRLIRITLKYPAELNFSQSNLKQIVERCNVLFPMETLVFRGKSFKRGMKVRVTTITKKTFEGELIGINSDNVVCVITKSFIAADILDHIVEIVAVSDPL